MAKPNLLEVPMTKGTFTLEGNLFGVKSEYAFKTNDKGNWRTVNLGVRVSDDQSVFFMIKGGEKDVCWLSKRSADKKSKPETKSVEWSQRKKEYSKGWNAMDVSLGLEQNEDGKNIIVGRTSWDAYDYLMEHAVDGTGVFVEGEIEFQSYKDNEGNLKKSQHLIAKKIYAKTAPVDFSAEGFSPESKFQQTVIFKGIEKTEENKTFMKCAVVGYNSYEEFEWEVSEKLVGDLKTAKVKVNNALKVKGYIKNSTLVEDEQPAMVWGEEVKIKSIKKSGKTYFFIGGADGNSLDVETYSQKILDEYISEVARLKKEKEEKANAFSSQGNISNAETWGDDAGDDKKKANDDWDE